MEPPNCRLFLCARRPGLLACLRAALEAGDVASLLIAEGEEQEMVARELIGPAQSHGVAVVIETDAALARKLGADGVQVADAAALRRARDLLGGEAAVGVAASSRHAAMEAGDAGADYLALPWTPGREADSLAAWWAGLFVVACVADGPAEPEAARRLAAAGVDFLSPPERMWDSPTAAREVVAATSAAIADAVA